MNTSQSHGASFAIWNRSVACHLPCWYLNPVALVKLILLTDVPDLRISNVASRLLDSNTSVLKQSEQYTLKPSKTREFSTPPGG